MTARVRVASCSLTPRHPRRRPTRLVFTRHKDTWALDRIEVSGGGQTARFAQGDLATAIAAMPGHGPSRQLHLRYTDLPATSARPDTGRPVTDTVGPVTDRGQCITGWRPPADCDLGCRDWRVCLAQATHRGISHQLARGAAGARDHSACSVADSPTCGVPGSSWVGDRRGDPARRFT